MSEARVAARGGAMIVAIPAALLVIASPAATMAILAAGVVWPHALPSSTSWGARIVALVLALYAGPILRASDSITAGGFLAGVIVAGALCRAPAKWLRPAWILGIVFLTWAMVHVGLDEALARWFSPASGLLYWNPVLWLGLLGTALRLSATRAIGLAALGAWVLLPAPVLAGAIVGLLGPALAEIADAVRRSAAARPMAWIAAGGAGLVLWNFLFMEQYRRNLIPRDDTVSFVDVAENNATLLAGAVGAPPTWPASWIFAARHAVPLASYEALASSPLRLMQAEDAVDADAPSSNALFVEGWSSPRACGPARCREMNGAARVLIRLSRAATVDLGLRLAGHGTVAVRVNGAPAADLPLTPVPSESRVRVAHDLWRAGWNELRLVSAAGPVTFERLVLRRVGGS